MNAPFSLSSRCPLSGPAKTFRDLVVWQTDKARYRNIAEGSLEGCRYYLILASDLGYGDTQHLHSALEDVSRLLNAYTAAIPTSSTSSS